MTTAYVYDERFHIHTMEGHPEFAGRLVAINRQFARAGLYDRVRQLDVVPASHDAVAAVHTEKYLSRLERTAEHGPAMFGLDTYVMPRSYEIACLAAGGVMGAVDAVLSGQSDNALVAVRPPGHHAIPTAGMGFCLLNNIAIAARHAQHTHGLERVAIVDFDVHHGNGTQDVFYADPGVLFISTHQSPLYPGTGSIHETGQEAGKGYTVNIPLPPGVGDQGYARVYDEIVLPLVQRYQPQLLLVSAGFDAHWADPLANMKLSLSGYGVLSRKLRELAAELCGGRIVFVLEGGYNLQVLSHGWANLAHLLLGDDIVTDPIGEASGGETTIVHIVGHIKQIHNLT